MKKLLKIGLAAAAVALGSLAPSTVEATQFAAPAIYGLTNNPVGTNAATFSLASGALYVPSSTTSNILSQPFPLVRDRGFAGNFGYYSTNGVTGTPSFVWQFATPEKLSGVYVTNWDTSPFVSNTGPACNGTNEVYGFVLNAGTTAQNVALGRLYSVITPASTPVYFDPTNTFVSVTP